MNFEKDLFEKEGLKIDKERVLTYSQLSCPLECRYCFVDDMNYNQKSGVAYLSENQFELLENLPDEIKTIMLGCDTEFFQSENDSLKTLERLSDLGRDISIITKFALRPSFLAKLKEVSAKLKQRGNLFVFSETIPCLESHKKWEPKAPIPERRIKTLKDASGQGLDTMVAIRPLLPDISEDEIRRIIELTKDSCFGYYSGPLYLKNLDSGLIDANDKSLKIEKVQPHWMPAENEFYRIEKVGQMEYLREVLNKYSVPLFEGAGEGIKYLRQKYAEHRN